MANGRVEWQHSGSTPKLWIIDARSIAIFLAVVMWFSEITLLLCVIIVGFLFYIEKYKRIKPEAAVRMMKMKTMNLILSNKRTPLGVRRKRYFSEVQR